MHGLIVCYRQAASPPDMYSCLDSCDSCEGGCHPRTQQRPRSPLGTIHVAATIPPSGNITSITGLYPSMIPSILRQTQCDWPIEAVPRRADKAGPEASSVEHAEASCCIADGSRTHNASPWKNHGRSHDDLRWIYVYIWHGSKLSMAQRCFDKPHPDSFCAVDKTWQRLTPRAITTQYVPSTAYKDLKAKACQLFDSALGQ